MIMRYIGPKSTHSLTHSLTPLAYLGNYVIQSQSHAPKPHRYMQSIKCGLLLPMFCGLCVCVRLSVDHNRVPHKTAEPIEVRLGLEVWI